MAKFKWITMDWTEQSTTLHFECGASTFAVRFYGFETALYTNEEKLTLIDDWQKNSVYGGSPLLMWNWSTWSLRTFKIQFVPSNGQEACRTSAKTRPLGVQRLVIPRGETQHKHSTTRTAPEGRGSVLMSFQKLVLDNASCFLVN